jgi:hypothetical protein
MADFQKIRDDLRESRGNHGQLQLDVSATAHRLRMLEQELDELQRQKSDNNEAYIRKRRQLEEQIAAAKAPLGRKREQLRAAKDKLFESEKAFEVFIDPRRELESHFSNQMPFLLFPLRMETRFKTVNNKSQLWVRVYPDECMVDSFEPLLSKKEVNNAARFWAEYYSAGKPADPLNPEPAVIEQQKAAWRLIVSAHGDGRAAWITRQLIPDEAESIFPVRGPKTVILAIVTDSWAAANQVAIKGLFKELWFANGNDKLIKQIKTDFNEANPALDADKIIAAYQPVNFDEKLPLGLKREDADLQFGIVIFKELEKKSGKEHSWSQPSRVNLLPERLALIRYKNNEAMQPIFGNPIPSPLPTSPDPSPDATEQFKQTPTGDLEFEESIRWVADFDRAVEIGMGFRVDLAADELNGFQRLFVLGVRLGADEAEGKKQLADLFDHHYFSKKGLSILPQGTPTNNTGTSDSGFSNKDHADESFEQYFKQVAAFEHNSNWTLKSDGQWLAEWLGLDEKVFTKVLNSGGHDQSDARNMNTALWPATMGYVLESLMQFTFKPETLELARNFFNSYVSGRGPIPAIRIGNQPYGILPTTAFRRVQWMHAEQRGGIFLNANNKALQFLNDLYQLLLRIEDYWNKNFIGLVAHIAQKETNAYKTLLEILSLHPTSVEFHRRYLESLIEMSNSVSIVKPAYHLHSDVVTNAMKLLKDTLGYPSDVIPQIAALLALHWEYPVNHLVDDVPISETLGIGEYTADKKNYLTALTREARKSENALRIGEGLTKRPDAELYRLLKYALEQGYHTSAVDAVATKNIFAETKLASMRLEQPFTHQQFKGEVAESRYSLLYQTIPEISPTRTVSEFIRDSMLEPVIPAFSVYLSSQLMALDQLENASTARLERAFIEHLDCCSYRLDAWKTGIITNELNYMRGNFPGMDDGQVRTGIYLGAFGWLENVRPDKNKIVTVKEIPGELLEDFNPGHNKVFLSDASNEGYIHAPSLNQGITAAVLRNGYVSHGKSDGNNVLAVNLSSERIRLALSVIEGIQGGQSLAALLGYHFERSLHDRKDLTAKSIDSYIYPLRKQFPLVADKLKDTKVKNNSDPSVDPETVPITAIEARNVVHGVNLANHVKNQTGSNKNYPFSLDLINADAAIGKAITEAVNEIIDIADAIADLGIAESVHHVVMGNYDRAAGVLETYSKGNYPQEPDVIRTPRSGATLTHRVAIPFTYVSTAAGTGPRPQSEPSVNQWLSNILPPMNKIVCQCAYVSRADGLQKKFEISLQDIGLKPIDLLYVLHALDTHALNEIDDRIIFHLFSTKDPRIDSNIIFNYTEEPTDPTKFSLFQVMPLVKSLRALLVESVPLVPTDLALPNEASKKDMPAAELPVQRVNDLKTALTTVITNAKAATGIIGYLDALPAKPTEAELDDIRSKVDDTINRFAALLLELSRFGIQQTGTGSLYTQRQQWFVGLKNKLQELVDRWQKKSDDYDILAGTPPSVETLKSMERLVAGTTTPEANITLAIVNAKKLLLDNEFSNLKIIANKKHATLSALVLDIQSLNTAAFDIIEFDIADQLRQIYVFVYDLQARAKTLMDDLQKKRIPAVDAILTTLPTLPAADQAKQIEAAARVILGDDFKMVPRYSLPPAQQAEISNSWNATNDLLNFLQTEDDRTNPTEDWLHGMARVHEKMKHLENSILLRSAFDMNEEDFTIHPMQLPFKTEKYHWLAMPFKENDIDLEKGNTLLYTAFTSQAATAPTEICGMLVDEWTELIPSKDETTGITFQYDRPNSEAPQTMLLVTPTKLTGNWQWNDLVDALSYTLDAAKSRAIEPEKIDKTAFASFLPAVLGAESLLPYSIVLDNKAHYMEENFVRNFEQPIN